ncbi:hypothetical protein ABZP36_029379 [Zizania latifolia]
MLHRNSVAVLEIRARPRPLIGTLEHLVPPLQFLTNACVVFFMIQSIDRLVLCLSCFWIRLKSIKPVLQATGKANLEASTDDFPMVLVQIPICIEIDGTEPDIPSRNGGEGFALDSSDRIMEANAGDKTSEVFAADSCIVDNNGVAEEEAPALMEFEDDCTTDVGKNAGSWNTTSDI